MYLFGGYDGSTRLNDFHKFVFSADSADSSYRTALGQDIPKPSLVDDLRGFVNEEAFSDIAFIVEGIPVYAHKILCLRCKYFRAMLAGDMRESREREVVIPDVRHSIFLALLEYLYTDDLEVHLDAAMELFETADRFGVERLKKMCESKMLESINVDNAAGLFHAADQHNASGLRVQCLAFILSHFDAVTKTKGFEEMGRTNVDLVFEILQTR
jgi:hypothetical protein